MRISKLLATGGLLVSSLMVLPIIVLGQTPQSYSWGIASPNVASVAWTDQQIATFLDAVTGSLAPLTVADFAFQDFDSDGQLELLASVDFSGRQLFNTIAIVRRQGSNFEVQQIETLNAQTVHGIAMDLNNVGRQELLVPTALTPYLGATTPQAIWTAIYGWNGLLLVDESSQFSTYYQNTVAPVLQQALINLQTTSPGTIQVDIAQIEYDKALRVSGQNPTAGLAEALIWASGVDETHRILAAAVLADIGTSSAISALNSLITDQDPNVVIYAQAAARSLPSLHFNSVQIEIKPGSTPSRINLKSKGQIPVAIISTSTFNAPALVNIQILTFGSNGTEDSLTSCASNGEDVNGDGLPDLVCHFDSQTSSFQTGDASGTLEGALKDGTAIRGTAPVVIVSQ